MASVQTVGDLQRQIHETAKSNFKPVLGTNVESEEKKNNSEAYSDVEKRVKEYLKNMETETAKVDKTAAGGENRGMSSLLYDRINDSFKERVKAQMCGYDNDAAEKLHKDEKLGNAERNEDALERKGNDEEVKKQKDELKTQGLVGRTLDKDSVKSNTSTVYKEGATVRLRFKHTRFMSENDMKKHIPDNYKVEGAKFYMMDNQGNDYLVEWAHGKADVQNFTNENTARLECEKMKELMKYSATEGYKTSTVQLRENADKSIETTLNKIRAISTK